MVGRVGFEPTKRISVADLQSAPFSRTWIPTQIYTTQHMWNLLDVRGVEPRSKLHPPMIFIAIDF